MKTLKGDTERREEIERNLKASHDAHPIQQPFPEEEEEEEETVVFKRKKSERSERANRHNFHIRNNFKVKKSLKRWLVLKQLHPKGKG